MISDNEHPKNSSNQEQIPSHEQDKNLSINQLKSRLNSMNVELDTKRHPKNYYLNMYNQAVNDLELSKKNQSLINNNPKIIKTIGNKIRENFMKIKRKRLDRGARDKYENRETRFLVTHDISNIRSADKSSFFGSDTKSKFKSITISKISFPILMDCDENIKLEPCEGKENFDDYEIRIDDCNLERSVKTETNNLAIDELAINDEVEHIAPDNYDSNSKIDKHRIKLISFKKTSLNPLATVDEEYKETNVQMTPRENESHRSHREDTGAAVRSIAIHYTPVIGDCSQNNKLISDTQDAEKEFQVFLEHQQQQQIKVKNENFSSKRSHKSHEIPNENSFRAPQSSNSLVRVIPAKSFSSRSLRRIQINESIIKTNLNNFFEFPSENKAIKENENILFDANDITHEFILKFRNYIIIFLLGSALAAVLYISFTTSFELLSSYSEIFKSSEHMELLAIPILILAGAAYVVYLKKRSKEITEKENKLIADNCFAGIKLNLLNKRECGVENPEIDTKDFIQEYCDSNKRETSLFTEEILPHITEHFNLDDSVEESSVYLDGVLKSVWRIKVSNNIS